VRIAKWTSIILGGLVLLLVATAFVLTCVVDPNRYRGKIEGIVGDLVGRPFVIEGNLDITWYPWLGLRTGAAHLDNLPAMGGTPLVEWQSIVVAAKVLPLLRGEIVADRIRLQGPRFHLRRDARGHGNWEDLGPRKVASSGPQGKTLQIAGIEIRDGMLDYVDEGSGLRVNLSGLELDVGGWVTGQPVPVHTRFLVQTKALPADGVWVQLDAGGVAIRAEPLAVAESKLSVRVAEARMDGDLTYEQTADAHVRAHGSLALHAPSLRKLANDLALNQTMPHDPTTLGPVELTTRWSYSDGSIAAKPLAVKLDGVVFNGWVERTAAPAAMWGFELHGDRIDLGRYVNVDSTNKKPFELPVDALRAINANGSVIFDQVVLADTHLANVRLRFHTPEGKQ
jgi:AsmA protein